MTYIMIQACRQIKKRRDGKFLGYIQSRITRIEEFPQVTTTAQQSLALTRSAIAKWRDMLGKKWLITGFEVNEEEASEVLADLEIGN